MANKKRGDAAVTNPAVRLIKYMDRLLASFYWILLEFDIYRPETSRFGFKDALLCPKDVYWWCRTSYVSSIVRHWNPRSVLDVGGGGTSISPFLRDIALLCVVDKSRPDLSARRENIAYVVGDGSQLPFHDKSFDVACSVAVLPQVPLDIRQKFLGELKRVASNACVYSEAVQDDYGRFKGLDLERRYHKALSQETGAESYSTEKLDRRQVRMSELETFGSIVKGLHNCGITYRYLMLSRIPIVGFLTGLAYWMLWRNGDDRPPFKSIVVVSEGS